VKEAMANTAYFPSFVVTKKVGLSGLVLSKLSSSLHVVYRSTDRRVNLGLNLKFEVKRQKVLGYTRKVDTTWEYSQKAVDLLQEYKRLFPEFITALERDSRQELYIAEEMYPGGNSVESIKKIEEWLKKSKVRDLERVDLDAKQLDKVNESVRSPHIHPNQSHLVLTNVG
jgi:5'-3' exoribonuclease 1